MLTYAEVGRRDRAETIVFLHGGNVSGWMWDAQVAHFDDFHRLVPDLPGYGASLDLDWLSIEDTADRVAELVAARAADGRAHVVGLSLGGVVAVHLVARHPHLVRSALVTGAPLSPVGRAIRALGALQLLCWRQRWFWIAQAHAFRLPEDVRDTFVSEALRMRKENVRRMMAQVYGGRLPPGLDLVDVPVLALAGQRDAAPALRSARLLADLMPTTQAYLVPRMHHSWNAEDPELFNEVTGSWVRHRRAHARLLDLD